MVLKRVIRRMNRKYVNRLFIIMTMAMPLWALDSGSEALAGSIDPNSLLKVYLDCQSDCDRQFLRREIRVANIVRYREEAQVHLLITSRRTGSGGRSYTLSFTGSDEFEGRDQSLVYTSNPGASSDEVRKGILRLIQLGLVEYAVRTPLVDRLGLVINGNSNGMSIADRWNSWVFQIQGDMHAHGEVSRTSLGLSGSIQADRITEDWKVRFIYRQKYAENHFHYEDEDPYKSVTRDTRFMGKVVRSLSDHWSAGLVTEVNSSLYRNLKLAANATPAIEYNIFPYSESERRELLVLYSFGLEEISYLDTTIYNKMAESLYRHALKIDLELIQHWGTVDIALQGSHYLHDRSKSRLYLASRINLRLTKGLSFSISGRYEAIHDQLSLPKSDVSIEDLLLQQRALETSYRYQLGVGLSYTFGSIYNTVVNSRM